MCNLVIERDAGDRHGEKDGTFHYLCNNDIGLNVAAIIQNVHREAGGEGEKDKEDANEHAFRRGRAIRIEDESFFVSLRPCELLLAASWGSGGKEVQGVFVVLNLANVAPQDVPDANDHNTELDGEWVKPIGGSDNHLCDVVDGDAVVVGLYHTIQAIEKVDNVAEFRTFCALKHVVRVGGERVSCCRCLDRVGKTRTVSVRVMLLHVGIESLVLDCVDPEAERSADAVHEGESGQDLILVDNDVSKLIDDVELEEGVDGVDHVMDPHRLAAGAEVDDGRVMSIIRGQAPGERRIVLMFW